jgi:rare lipoprotein A
MPFLPANAGARMRGVLFAAILSLGLAEVGSAQFVNPVKPEPKKPAEEGLAAWYPVPSKSLAKKRAGSGELTAAHNKLPIGTRVRVTHLGNQKSVVVRITDRGISNRRFVIDLCKEAAEKLDMLREGSTRVRLEILPDDKKSPGK